MKISWVVILFLLFPLVAIANVANKAPHTCTTAKNQHLEEGIKLLYKENQYPVARYHLELSLNHFNKLNDKVGQTLALGNLGVVYRRLGQYQKAIDTLLKAKAIAHSLPCRYENEILNNLGNAYQALGKYDEAKTVFEQNLAISKKDRDSRNQSIALINLGSLHASLGNYEQALNFHLKSHKLAIAIRDNPGIARAANNLGIAYSAVNKNQQAKSHFEEAIKLSKDFGYKTTIVEALINLGLLYEDERKYDKAIKSYQDAMVHADKINDPSLSAAVLNNLGHAYLDSGKPAAAEIPLYKAIHFLDKLRHSLEDLDNVSLFDTQVMTYNLLQQVLIAQNKFEQALEVSEQGRARALMATLINSHSTVTNAGRDDVLISVDRIKQLAKELNNYFIEYTLIPVDEFKVLGKQRGKTGKLYMWLVTPSGEIHFRQVNLNNAKLAIDELIGSLRTRLGVRGRNASGSIGNPQNKLTGNADLTLFYSYLIRPLENLLPKDPEHKIAIIPQESLFMLPWAALRKNDNLSFLEQHTFYIAPSIKVLNEITIRNHSNKSEPRTPPVLVVGNPKPMPIVSTKENQEKYRLNDLPGTEDEANEIARLLKATPLIGNHATKKSVLSKINNAGILHFATHGLLDSVTDDPIPGAIALAASDNDSGLLSAQEISNLKLNAQLATLSACDTGGGLISGDSVVGLSRSFMTAGVKSVIVSLWKVPDDSTAFLMKEFYQDWLVIHDKVSALRAALLKTKQRYPDPKSWAAFILLGQS